MREAPPGVNSYVDALAALVPAEVLTVHALILTVTTETSTDAGTTTTITAPDELRVAFYGLLVLSVILYLVPKLRSWDRLDYARALIPPAAFVAWTMLQRATAFDAVMPSLSDAFRTIIALFAAVLLGLAAASLAGQADNQDPA
jgi:hypothetical protein